MNKKITIFMKSIYIMGGIEKVVTLFANELSKNYNVEIISLYKINDKPFYNLNKSVKLYYILEKEKLPIRLAYPYLRYTCKRFFKEYNTDTFIVAGMGYVGLTTFVSKKSNYIAWEHMNSYTGKIGGVMWLGRKLAAKYADEIVVLTKKDMQNNIKMFGTESKIHQIYNPIEMKQSVLDYKLDSKLILSSGRFEYQKGFDMLIDVASKVFEKHPDWQWHIYGDGPDKEKIEKSIIEKGLEKNVILKGRTNKMLELYNDYAIFILTSRFEGFAMVNIEAHCSKLPIVSFDCNCGPSEIIQDGVNGYLIDCFDINEMANKINYLIENPNIRKEMSDNTYLGKEKIKMQNIINEWEKIL